MSLSISHPLDWSRPARLALLVGAAMTVCASGFFFCIGEQREQAQHALQRRHELQHQFKLAWTESDRLPSLRLQQNTLAASLLRLQEQDWNEESLGQLQQKISRRAQECGLTLAAYQPVLRRPDTKQVDAVVHLSGSYRGLVRFLQLIAAPPQALTVAELDIRPLGREGNGTALQVTATLAAPLASTPSLDKP